RMRVGCHAGRAGEADWPEMLLRMARILRLLPGRLGASFDKIEELAEDLPAPSSADYAGLFTQNQMLRAAAACLKTAAEEKASKRIAAEFEREKLAARIAKLSAEVTRWKREAVALRYKARRYDETKAEVPRWRAKANRWDQLPRRR